MQPHPCNNMGEEIQVLQVPHKNHAISLNMCVFLEFRMRSFYTQKVVIKCIQGPVVSVLGENNTRSQDSVDTPHVLSQTHVFMHTHICIHSHTMHTLTYTRLFF